MTKSGKTTTADKLRQRLDAYERVMSGLTELAGQQLEDETDKTYVTRVRRPLRDHYTPQQIGNWKERGLPDSEWRIVAGLMKWRYDYVATGSLPREEIAAPPAGAHSIGTNYMPPRENTSPRSGKPSQTERLAVSGVVKMHAGGWFERLEIEVSGSLDMYSSDPDAYAFQVRGHELHPVIKDGWFVIVEPRSKLVEGEYVVVGLHDGRLLLAELLYLRNDSIVVSEATDGSKRSTIYRSDIKALHHVVSFLMPSKWHP